VEREGAGQVVLCGPPNSGKSQLLANLAQVEAEVADYPFTTRSPQPGMMRYEDIQIQIVDTPPLAEDSLEAWQLAMVKQADAAYVLFDVNDPGLLEQTDFILKIFAERGISWDGVEPPRVRVLGNKADRPSGLENFAVWQELYQDRFRARPFSAREVEDVGRLRQEIFDLLGIVRIYTKAPGKKAEEHGTPFVMKRGGTVLDAAALVHKDLAANLKFARLWRAGRVDGLMVERHHVLEDKDLIEIHAG
jgi:ribosome-interacting GTPase 1